MRASVVNRTLYYVLRIRNESSDLNVACQPIFCRILEMIWNPRRVISYLEQIHPVTPLPLNMKISHTMRHYCCFPLIFFSRILLMSCCTWLYIISYGSHSFLEQMTHIIQCMYRTMNHAYSVLLHSVWTAATMRHCERLENFKIRVFIFLSCQLANNCFFAACQCN